MAAVQQTF